MSRNKIPIISITLIIFLSVSSFCAEEPSTQTSRTSTQPAQPQLTPEVDYLLSPFDEIEIKVIGEEDLSGVYKINNEGYVVLPLIGRVKVDESTITEAEDSIARLLEKDYFRTKVIVSIQVKKFHKRKIVISGEVHKPGPYEIEEEKSMSLVELITLAGGPTEKACLNAATIIRREGRGKGKTLKVKASDIMEAKENDIALKSGDRVNIPSASVIIMGEVVKPGTYNFGDVSKMTLLGAISMAGGFTRIAAINGVKIIRMDESGNEKRIHVKVKNIYKGRERDVPLEPNDLIIVPESWF